MSGTPTSVVIQRNKEFASQSHQAPGDDGIVCVFAGASCGIGARTLEKMVTMFHCPATFYVLGRRPSSQPDALRIGAQKRFGNPGSKIIFVDVDISLMSGIDTASRHITSEQQQVDYLCMSMSGVTTPKAAEYTKEDMETQLAVSYYARMRLLSNLLPLLRRSPSPRVLNILNIGREQQPIDGMSMSTGTSTSNLEAIVNHNIFMINLVFNHLAAENGHISFVHNFTGIETTTKKKKRTTATTMTTTKMTEEIFRCARMMAIPALLRRAARRVRGRRHDAAAHQQRKDDNCDYDDYNNNDDDDDDDYDGYDNNDDDDDDVTAERQVYYLTSYPCGNHPLLVYDGDEMPFVCSHTTATGRDEGWHAKAWELTVRVCERALVAGLGSSAE